MSKDRTKQSLQKTSLQWTHYFGSFNKPSQHWHLTLDRIGLISSRLSILLSSIGSLWFVHAEIFSEQIWLALSSESFKIYWQKGQLMLLADEFITLLNLHSFTSWLPSSFILSYVSEHPCFLFTQENLSDSIIAIYTALTGLILFGW